MENCQECGIPYNDSFADWTICRDCKLRLIREGEEKVEHIDNFDIYWTENLKNQQCG